MKQDQRITTEDAGRARRLLAADGAPQARACLRMLDEGATINDAAAAAGTDMFELMSWWHAFADAHGITATDGQRACIHVLASAYEGRAGGDAR